MKKYLLTISWAVSACVFQTSTVMAFENELTHRELTREAVKRSVLAGATGYLQEQLGLENGLDTPVELLLSVQSDLEVRLAQDGATWGRKTSLRPRLMDGSFFEDVPIPRARHHFHDATANQAGNNPKWV
jgi:hypothetical protein